MNPSEKATLIQTLYKAAYDQTKNEYNLPNGKFFTIDEDGKVGEWGLGTNTIFAANVYTICCLHSYYQSYGWQNYYQVFAILNKEGQLIDRISKNTWTINKIAFHQSREPSSPVPIITFSLNIRPEQTTTCTFYQTRSFQQIWDFFSEIDENCETISEVNLYSKYFENKFETNMVNKSIEEYKIELDQKNNIINQYKTLLENIQNIVDREFEK